MSDNMETMFLHELEKVRDQAKRCALAVMEYTSDETIRAEYLKQLEGVLESCVKSEHSVALSREAAQEAETRAVHESTGHPSADLFDECFEENLEELQEDSDVWEAIKKAPSIRAFKQLVAEHLACSSEARERESTERNEDSDMEELVTTQQTVSLVDPISKTVMKDPVRHKHCGHVYDRSSVTSIIKANGKKGFRCPTMGCGYRKPLKLKDMEDALDVKRQIMRQHHR